MLLKSSWITASGQAVSFFYWPSLVFDLALNWCGVLLLALWRWEKALVGSSKVLGRVVSSCTLASFL